MSAESITLEEVERRLIEARLEFERTGDPKDRDVVLTLARAREKLRQAQAMAWARAANAHGDAQLSEQGKPLVAEPARPKLPRGR